LVETIQENGVCSVVLSPAPNANNEVIELTESIAKRIADGLGVTGMLAVELFESRDGRILINELAMRPHNSGHFSIEGSTTSQFEQHLRAVLDLPLGETKLRAKSSVMVNLLGVDSTNDFSKNHAAAKAIHPEISIHTYGKTARIGRKMGHITCIAESLDEALTGAKGAAAVLLQG
jgi:5-(carboxyamino)imidazole ribonucleotide synthase